MGYKKLSKEEIEKIQKKKDEIFARRMKILLSILLLIFIFIIYLIYLYISTTLEDREVIDESNSTINGPYIDIPTNILINCSNEEPCVKDCHYIKTHIHRIPEECEYDDYMDYILIIFGILCGCGIINCICGKSKKGG